MIRSGTTPGGIHYGVRSDADRFRYFATRTGENWFAEAGSEPTHAAAVEAICEIVREKEKQT